MDPQIEVCASSVRHDSLAERRSLSRGNGADWFLSTALLPVGMFGTAPVADAVGTRPVFYVGAAAVVLLVTANLVRGDLRQYGRPTTPSGA